MSVPDDETSQSVPVDPDDALTVDAATSDDQRDPIDPEHDSLEGDGPGSAAAATPDEPSGGIEQELARLAEVLDPATAIPLPPEEPDAPQRDEDPADGSEALDETPGDAPSRAATPQDEIAAARAAGGREARSAAEGWRTLARGLRPRATKGQVLAGVLCAVLGFALVVQVRQTASVSLSSMRQEDLLRILDEATTRSDDLAREVSALERERDQLLSDDDTREAARDAARRTAIAQGILTGRLPAQGPGVTATILDPEGTVKPVTLLNFMEELRNAGAEALELNGQRVTASSAFTGSAGSVVLDGVTISPPYRWKAIGDPDTIAPALEMPGGAVATVRGNGGSASVDQQDLVTIDSLRTAPDPTYATPVPPEAG